MRRKITFVVVLFVGALIVVLAVLFLKRDKMVVIAHLGSANIYDEHSYEILNPFRDRRREIEAEAFFREFQNHCEKALAAISDDSAHIKYTCERESLHPLIDWSLRARQDESSSATLLRYEVFRYEDRGSSKKMSDPFWVLLKKDNNDWHMTRYETWY